MQTIFSYTEAVELIKNIDNYISQNEPEQLEDLKILSDMSKDICGLDKTVTIYSDNISLFQSFFKLKSEIHLLSEQIRAEEESKSAAAAAAAADEAKRVEDAKLKEEKIKIAEAEARNAEKLKKIEETRLNEIKQAEEQRRQEEILQLHQQLKTDENEMMISEIKCVTPSQTPVVERKSITPSPIFLDAKSVTPSPLIFADKPMENTAPSSSNGNYTTYNTTETSTEISSEVITKTYTVTSEEIPGNFEAISKPSTTTNDSINPSILNTDDILMQPNFIKLLKNGTAKEGQSFEFDCQVAGNPMPSIEWYRNDVSIDNLEAYSFSYENGCARMTIKNTNLNDQAIFMCKAINSMGNDQTKAYLSVQRKY